MVTQFIKPKYQMSFFKYIMQIARYDQSRYNTGGYYQERIEPPVQHGSVSSVFYQAWTPVRYGMSVASKVPEWTMQHLGEVAKLGARLVRFRGFWGFGMWGVSSWSPMEETARGRVTPIDYTLPDGRRIKIRIRYLQELFGMNWWGVGRWGASRWTVGTESIYTNEILNYIKQRLRDMEDRYIANLTGQSLWEGPKVELGVEYSTKAHRWGEFMSIRAQIETVVDAVLAKYHVDPITARKYKSFALEYVFGRFKRRNVCLQGQNVFDDQQFETYVVEKWLKLGLDPNIVEELRSRLRPVVRIVWERLFRLRLGA